MDPKNKRTRDVAFYVLILVILLAAVYTWTSASNVSTQ